jgi:hypothetical protein
MPITVSFIISMLETLKLIHFFLTEYAGWAFSKEALDPGQSLFIFFHTDEIGREAFGYTSHHDAVIIMFFTGLLVTLPVLYGSTVYATSDFFGAEEDTTAYTSGLLEDPDYVFFYGALLDGALRLDGDTSEHEPVHENSWVGSLDESDAHAFNYDVSYFTLAPYG